MPRITEMSKSIIVSLSLTDNIDQALQVGFSLHAVMVGVAIYRRGVGLENACSACSRTLVMSALKDFEDIILCSSPRQVIVNLPLPGVHLKYT